MATTDQRIQLSLDSDVKRPVSGRRQDHAIDKLPDRFNGRMLVAGLGSQRRLELVDSRQVFLDRSRVIDPSIRGCWVGNNLDPHRPEGGTTLASVFFDRGEGMGFRRKAGVAQVRQSYLTSEKLEPLDLQGMSLPHLIGLFHKLDDFRSAVDTFLFTDALRTHDEKGRITGATWNGEMLEVLRAWAEDASSNLIEAIRAYKPEDAHLAYQRALFLIWWEAEIGGELHDGAASATALGERAGNTASRVMIEFGKLDEAGREQLLAAARDMVAHKQAA